MRNKTRPVKHFKRLLHFDDSTIWSWRLKRRGSCEAGNFEQGIQVRSPLGKDTFIDQLHFVGPERRVPGDGYGLCGPFGCEICTKYIHTGPGYQPRVIKNYIQTVIVNGGVWENYP